MSDKEYSQQVRAADAIEDLGECLDEMAKALTKMPAPVVNVKAPTVNVEAPVVNIKPADVKVEVEFERPKPCGFKVRITEYDKHGRIVEFTMKPI